MAMAYREELHSVLILDTEKAERSKTRQRRIFVHAKIRFFHRFIQQAFANEKIAISFGFFFFAC